ncbi:hypothetical protein [Bacillus pseudomycoides]|uniref:hypothetical protein n=1 Tax=Bacillus pseudomycoides TaxID=64104 RepID=UPI0001A14E65|nr:hypothetical protein [Bacillus pseudomycoides]EEM02292.1 hypothetical protein bmyco0002_53570 [Bacillus pseudomycoides]PEJ22153.1 hypothetical protein CN887_23350 [Bacillus pseudomycoides]PFY85615.1 hypothetical protein COL53_26430 [Bacillus pseudomycoides]PGC31016.1 hypothetical protein COM18_28415 [Bacillus pseudomycoides]PHG29586.1 hypothetical protein COI43_18055 [Bacillus pseudomycoides]
MKCWNEVEEDAFSYYKWFSKDEAIKRVGNLPNLSVFSVNGSMLFSPDEKKQFKEVCGTEIKQVFMKHNLTNVYKFYLLAAIEIKDKNSKIEKYRKVWKALQTKWQLEKFNKGSEVEMEVGGTTFYSSIAEFCLEELPAAIEIVSSNPKRFTIISSKNSDMLMEENISRIFRKAFNEYNQWKDEIDYFNLSIHLCPKDDIVFRWGDSLEEAEIATIFKRDILTLLNS